MAIEDAGTALLTGSVVGEPAFWKRYRGGRTGKLWTATGPTHLSRARGPRPSPRPSPPLFTRVLADLDGQLASPMLIGGRLFFLSDHEGTGNIYSCALDGGDLRRHTDHDGMYARNPSTDGQRIVYHVAGDIWILDSPDAAEPRKLEVTLGSPAPGRAPRLVSAEDHLGGLDCDKTGQASVVEVRGTVHWLTHKDGPARALHVDPAARARLPRVLGETGQVVWVTDASGTDALEIASTSGEQASSPRHGPARARDQPGCFPGRGYCRRCRARRQAAGRRCGVRAGHRAGRVRRRGDQRVVLVAGLGLAGLVPAREPGRWPGSGSPGSLTAR